MFGETTIFYVMLWNHPIETTNKNRLFGVPGTSYSSVGRVEQLQQTFSRKR